MYNEGSMLIFLIKKLILGCSQSIGEPGTILILAKIVDLDWLSFSINLGINILALTTVNQKQ